MLVELLPEAIDIVSKRPALVRLQAERVLFIGDLHGYPDVLDYVERELSDEKMHVVFLGDYVDRGPKQVETFTRVIELLTAYPERVITLRGNHEDEQTNRIYGFYDVVMKKFGPDVYEKIKEFYKNLPIAVDVNEKVFGVHGGIPVIIPKTTEALESVKKTESTLDDPIREFLRNDPNEEIEEYAPSIRGEGIYEFGRKPLEEFMRRYGYYIVIRAHQIFYNGYKRHFGGKMLTITSLPPDVRVATVYFHGEYPIVHVSPPRIY